MPVYQIPSELCSCEEALYLREVIDAMVTEIFSSNNKMINILMESQFEIYAESVRQNHAVRPGNNEMDNGGK